jgi:uncharacterized protein
VTEERAEGQGWQRAVREAMGRSAQDEARQRYGVASPAFDYRWEHVRAVARLAERLGRLVGADLEVLEAAAWLHDVAKGSGEDHPEQGAAFARDFLAQTDFPAEKIGHVAQVIRAHQGLWRDEPLQDLEAMVLWDADKLTKMGLTAAFHWTAMVIAGDEPLSTEALIEMGRRSDWQERTLKSMHTEPARRAARARLEVYARLWDQLEAELRGDDLGQGS